MTTRWGSTSPGPVPSDLPSELRREIEALEGSQDEIRESLAKIAERLENPEDNPRCSVESPQGIAGLLHCRDG